MTWPTADVVTTNLDAGADDAALARSDLLDLTQKFNQLRAHVTAFMQTLLSRSDAAGARGDLGVANHQLVTVDASGNTSVPGSFTAGGDITAFSDERLKQAWSDLPADFITRLAGVKAGTYELRALPGRRHAGVSAQALQQVLPEAVSTSPDEILGVAYGQAALVACVALAREVQELRAQLRGRA